MAKTDAKKKTWAFLFLQEPIITIGVPMFYEPIVAMDSTGTPSEAAINVYRRLPGNWTFFVSALRHHSVDSCRVEAEVSVAVNYINEKPWKTKHGFKMLLKSRVKSFGNWSLRRRAKSRSVFSSELGDVKASFLPCDERHVHLAVNKTGWLASQPKST